jgi:hypothetical protein
MEKSYQKESILHPPYTHTRTSWSGCMTRCSQGSGFRLDNTWETTMPHVFPTYSSTYKLIRSKMWKKATQCLGEEPYKEGLPPRIPACKPCHWFKGSNPGESKGDAWTSQGLKDPQAGKPPQTRVDIEHWCKGPQDNHVEKANPEWGPQGIGRPHRSVEPTLRPPLRSFHMVLPDWLLLHSRVLTPFSWSCPGPINRREGTHLLPNSLSNSSLTYGFQG